VSMRAPTVVRSFPVGSAAVRGLKRVGIAALFGMAVVAAPGCQLIGGMAESARRSGSSDVRNEYDGLEGKSFAVVVAADRSIQMEHPGLVEYLTNQITARLAESTNKPRAGGYVPPKQVLKLLYDNPALTLRPKSEIAKRLGGVERLVWVDLFEYRLHDAGNQYEWDGAAAGTVAVVEIDGPLPDDFAWEKGVNVKFPGKTGLGPGQMDRSLVTSALAKRFTDRASWLFYDHEEPNEIEY